MSQIGKVRLTTHPVIVKLPPASITEQLAITDECQTIKKPMPSKSILGLSNGYFAKVRLFICSKNGFEYWANLEEC